MPVDTSDNALLRTIVQTQVTVTTVGDAESATGAAVTPENMNGFLLEVAVDYHADTPATTHLVVTDTDTGAILLTLADTATDVTKWPRINVHDSAGAAIAGVYEMYPLCGSLTVTLINSDALAAAAVVTFKWLHA